MSHSRARAYCGDCQLGLAPQLLVWVHASSKGRKRWDAIVADLGLNCRQVQQFGLRRAYEVWGAPQALETLSEMEGGNTVLACEFATNDPGPRF